MMENPINILFWLFDMLLSLTTNLYNFLFTETTLLGLTFTPFYAIGGGVIITLLVAYIIKLVTPFL